MFSLNWNIILYTIHMATYFNIMGNPAWRPQRISSTCLALGSGNMESMMKFGWNQWIFWKCWVWILNFSDLSDLFQSLLSWTSQWIQEWASQWIPSQCHLERNGDFPGVPSRLCPQMPWNLGKKHTAEANSMGDLWCLMSNPADHLICWDGNRK